MSVIILDNEIVHYEVIGRGRPVVFLHGWVGSWRYWVPAMQAASASFRTYALDFWGFGDTAHKSINYSIDQQVSLLERFLKSMGMGKICLVAHSLGAIVALNFADHQPQSVDRLFITACPIEQPEVATRLQGRDPVELADWLLERHTNQMEVRQEAHKTDPMAILMSLDHFGPNNNLTSLLYKNHTDCVMVYGKNDLLITPLADDHIDALGENFHKVVFDGAGHFPMLDQPRQFNRLLMDFLALAPGESPQQLKLKVEWKRRVR